MKQQVDKCHYRDKKHMGYETEDRQKGIIWKIRLAKDVVNSEAERRLHAVEGKSDLLKWYIIGWMKMGKKMNGRRHQTIPCRTPASIEESQNGALFNSHFTKELERKQTFKTWCAKSTFFNNHTCPKRQSTKKSQQWNRTLEKRALSTLETLGWRSPTFWRKFQLLSLCHRIGCRAETHALEVLAVQLKSKVVPWHKHCSSSCCTGHKGLCDSLWADSTMNTELISYDLTKSAYYTLMGL